MSRKRYTLSEDAPTFQRSREIHAAGSYRYRDTSSGKAQRQARGKVRKGWSR